MGQFYVQFLSHSLLAYNCKVSSLETAGDEKKGILHKVINVIHTENEMSNFSCIFFLRLVKGKGLKG